jgi:hypothetical protein
METSPINQLIFSKELFIETINAVEIQHRHDQKCSKAFSVILPNDHTSYYDNHHLQNQLVKLLQIAMNDDHAHSWIEYFIWELDFGLKWKEGKLTLDGKDYKLDSAEKL